MWYIYYFNCYVSVYISAADHKFNEKVYKTSPWCPARNLWRPSQNATLHKTLNVQERIEYKIISTKYKLSSPVHVTCVISSHSSLLDPLDHWHCSLSSSHQLTQVSRSKPLFPVCHTSPVETSFLLLFMFLISLVRHHHPIWSQTTCWRLSWRFPLSS